MAQKVLPSKLRDLISASLDELKAVDPVTINVKKLSSFTDYMIIASGTSNRHIQSIGEKVLEDLKAKKINHLVNTLVEEYINEHGLYGEESFT